MRGAEIPGPAAPLERTPGPSAVTTVTGAMRPHGCDAPLTRRTGGHVNGGKDTHLRHGTAGRRPRVRPSAPSLPEGGQRVAATKPRRTKTVVHVLWINAGLSCDGDSVALTAATQPSIEEIALGALPGLPKIAVHWPLIDFECGPVGGADDFIEWFFKADRGELEPFVLVVEGSIPNEAIKTEGYWCGFGNNPDTDQPMTTSEWLDRLAPKALAVLAVGTCATYGGIHAMAGNPTGAMGVPDYLGLGLEVQGRHPDRVRPGLPGPAATTCPRRSSTCCTRRPARRR